jgi:hypothetical protein
MLINAQHPRAERINILQPQQARLGHRRRTIHHDTANPPAVPDTALPERMTASTSWSRRRLVDRARRGTWGVDSKNDSRPQAGSSQYHRYLDHSTSLARPQ